MGRCKENTFANLIFLLISLICRISKILCFQIVFCGQFDEVWIDFSNAVDLSFIMKCLFFYHVDPNFNSPIDWFSMQFPASVTHSDSDYSGCCPP